MNKTNYDMVEWKDFPDTSTETDAHNFNIMDRGIKDVSFAVNDVIDHMTSEDGLAFKFSNDGDGNYGFRGADGSFIPFLQEGIKGLVDLGISVSAPITISVDLSDYCGIVVHTDGDKQTKGYHFLPIGQSEYIVEINHTLSSPIYFRQISCTSNSITVGISYKDAGAGAVEDNTLLIDAIYGVI